MNHNFKSKLSSDDSNKSLNQSFDSLKQKKNAISKGIFAAVDAIKTIINKYYYTLILFIQTFIYVTYCMNDIFIVYSREVSIF